MIALCFSCKSKVTAQEKTKALTDFSAAREKFKPMVYSANQASKGGPADNYIWSSESDFVSASGDCYVINVRVYLTYQNQTTLVASDNVQVGNGCEQKRDSGYTNNSECEGTLPDGNKVIKLKTDQIYCLYELLTVNSDIYKSYRKTIANY